ncbi:MAG: helix-turn-helix transcriptional regulator [Clostridia bacterium]|nr:helix-turn-helix transcriptional regulator [Clostridia bacterium]
MKKFDISNLAVLDIEGIYRSCLATDSEARARARSSLLIVKRTGKTSYVFGSDKYVADEENILFIPKGAEYEMYIEREGECTVIELTVSDAEKYSPCLFYTGGDKDVFTAVRNILHYWTLRGPAYRSKCLSELYSLLTQISSIQSFSSSLAGKYGLIHRSVKFIEANYSRQDLYTPMLAEMSGMGETYYRSIFIAVFGVAPTRYIQQYRVDKAKELLIKSGGSVEDIAVSVGFANSSYFCKVFKSITGLTPSQFAEKGRLVG